MQGTRLGKYEIRGAIGAGGMGEVYRAHDPRLKRDVAIKLLPAELSADPDRLARLQREAMLLAALTHPNVAGIYGFEEADGKAFLAMELVEGMGLDEMIADGPLPLEEALSLAAQIAAGLEAAHEAGMIHRDLKPANVRVTPAGDAKVLDFGLAKGASEALAASGSRSPDLTASPTMAAPTMAGAILGTAAYMSPEQARGKPLDRRSDVWSFGCVLYEMLSGVRPFDGETVTDILAAVVKEEPDFDRLPAALPPRLRTLLRRCFVKDPRRRLRDIGDARIEIEDTLAGVDGTAPGASSAGVASTRGVPLPLAFVAAVVLAAGAWILASYLERGRASGPTGGTPVHLEISPAEGAAILNHTSWPALSPDGSAVAYGVRQDGNRHIEIRRLDEFSARVVDGTEGGRDPVFSPDGQWLAFRTDVAQMKVPLAGGRPVRVASIGYQGVTWLPDGRLVSSGDTGAGLAAVSAEGGEYERITTPGAGEKHMSPVGLPDGSVLFVLDRADRADTIAHYDPSTGAYRDLGLEASMALGYVPSGHLLFQRQEAVFAVTFDVGSRRAGSDVVPVLDDSDSYHVRVSPSGAVVYLHAPVEERYSILRSDLGGSTRVIVSGLPFSRWMRVSPDGTKIANGLMARTGLAKIWVSDVATGRRTLMADDGSDSTEPVFSPDGSRVLYSSGRGRVYELHWQLVDGSGVSEMVKHEEFDTWPTDFSPDGKTLAYYGRSDSTGDHDIWTLSMEGDHESRLTIGGPGAQKGLRFSPDGKWVVYSSTESGRGEIYARPYPALDRKVPVSVNGGLDPAWSRDGKTISFIEGDRMMAADVVTEPEFQVAVPRELFRTPFEVDPWGDQSYDVFPNGDFALIRADPGSQWIRVITDYTGELSELLPAGEVDR